MSNEGASNFVNSSEMEEAIVAKAKERFSDAWDLAINTEDQELFARVWQESLTLVLDDILTSLIEKGLVEVAGMNGEGEMTFSLTSAGERIKAEEDNG